MNCTAQFKSASLSSHAADGLFAVLDGGRSPKVPEALCAKLEDTLVEEFKEEEEERREGFLDLDPLQYLSYTFLSLHRQASCLIQYSEIKIGGEGGLVADFY